ncbi:hypothetical protein BDQ94DRAFT_140713 [Aspergillus welwitschiae]|uniref:Uncharacterized protein n=1 Tax=Aspergillus welwitschiae TaxID=1341132 RepID=A0A3F3Q608_9EURO|nr:hypothetical protein BDQ94DRAFT_140713 [Aspergillus welwitschiae]RDH34654.1 hypothetical protein BDQ94DRAFT_140713 [Aspergillus welwitschiae]
MTHNEIWIFCGLAHGADPNMRRMQRARLDVMPQRSRLICLPLEANFPCSNARQAAESRT